MYRDEMRLERERGCLFHTCVMCYCSRRRSQEEEEVLVYRGRAEESMYCGLGSSTEVEQWLEYVLWI